MCVIKLHVLFFFQNCCEGDEDWLFVRVVKLLLLSNVSVILHKFSDVISPDKYLIFAFK